MSELADLDHLAESLAERDFGFVDAGDTIRILSALASAAVERDQAFLDRWDRLEEDPYMADGGRYRKRRHANLRGAEPG